MAEAQALPVWNSFGNQGIIPRPGTVSTETRVLKTSSDVPRDSPLGEGADSLGGETCPWYP
jgi:hypothetical protein